MALAADAVPGVTIDPGGRFSYFGLPYVMGWKFDVTTNQNLVGLGMFDNNNDGFTGDQQVGLWDTGGALLVSGVVHSDDTLISRFRFTSVTPLKLLAGHSYIVGATVSGEPGDAFWESTTLTTAPGITYVSAQVKGGAGLLFPEQSIAGRIFIGGNVLVRSATPEPTGWALMLTGFGSAGYMIRRRRARLNAA